MKKQNPAFYDDQALYNCTSDEVCFALNSRRKIDRNFGNGFNDFFLKSEKLHVGFRLYTAEDVFSEDIFFPKLADTLSSVEVEEVFATPTGYFYENINKDSIELTEFDPPLIAKAPVSPENLMRFRGSMIGIYGGKYLIFSNCLRYGVLDFNGYYSMIMGPRSFVERALETSVERSWDEVRLGTSIEPELLNVLRDTMSAYGY